MKNGLVVAANVSDVEVGKPLRVDVSGHDILLCKSDETIFAIENRCSHAQEPLECGRIRLGWISCPAHGARFDLETGEALTQPATDPIKIFAVKIEGGEVLVALD